MPDALIPTMTVAEAQSNILHLLKELNRRTPDSYRNGEMFASALGSSATVRNLLDIGEIEAYTEDISTLLGQLFLGEGL